MKGPEIVCVACGKVTNSMRSNLVRFSVKPVFPLIRDDKEFRTGRQGLDVSCPIRDRRMQKMESKKEALPSRFRLWIFPIPADDLQLVDPTCDFWFIKRKIHKCLVSKLIPYGYEFLEIPPLMPRKNSEQTQAIRSDGPPPRRAEYILHFNKNTYSMLNCFNRNIFKNTQRQNCTSSIRFTRQRLRERSTALRKLDHRMISQFFKINIHATSPKKRSVRQIIWRSEQEVPNG